VSEVETGTGTLTELGAARIGADHLAGVEVTWAGRSQYCVNEVRYQGKIICGLLSYVGPDPGIIIRSFIWD
jgi:hypothetical protein